MRGYSSTRDSGHGSPVTALTPDILNSGLLDAAQLVPQTGEQAPPLQDGQLVVTYQDLHAAFTKLSHVVHPETGKCGAVLYGALLIISGLGIWPGVDYASKFADKFATLVMKSSDESGTKFFKAYVQVCYFVANLVVSLRSMQLNVGAFKEKLFSSGAYKQWHAFTASHVTTEVLQSVVAIITAAIGCIAVDEQNKALNPSAKLSRIVFDYITRFIGDAVSGVQMLRAIEGLFDADVQALMKSTLCGRGFGKRAQLHAFKRELLVRALSMDPTINLENMLPHLDAVADGYNNKFSPVYNLPALGLIGYYLIYPYVKINYVEASEEELEHSELARNVAPIVAGAMTVLFTKATTQMVMRYIDGAVAKLSGMPTTHSPELTWGMVATDMLKIFMVVWPSSAAASMRYAKFSDNRLSTAHAVLRAFFKGGVSGATGLNLLDLNKVSEDTLPSLAASAMRLYNPQSVAANRLNYGKDFRAFVKKLAHRLTQDSVARRLGRLEDTEEKERLIENEAGLNNSDSTLNLNVKYPNTSALSALASLFHSNYEERVVVQEPAMLNAMAIVQACAEAGVDMNAAYAFWLETLEGTLQDMPQTLSRFMPPQAVAAFNA